MFSLSLFWTFLLLSAQLYCSFFSQLYPLRARLYLRVCELKSPGISVAHESCQAFPWLLSALHLLCPTSFLLLLYLLCWLFQLLIQKPANNMNLSYFLSRVQHKANHREKPKTPTSLNKINLSIPQRILPKKQTVSKTIICCEPALWTMEFY